MKKYQKQAIKLAGEILSQPEFRLDRYPPHKWCSLRVINGECYAKYEAECQTCHWFKK